MIKLKPSNDARQTPDHDVLKNYQRLADAIIRQAILDTIKSKNAFIDAWNEWDRIYRSRMNLYPWNEIIDARKIMVEIPWDRYQSNRDWFNSPDFEFYNRGRYDKEYILDKEMITFSVRRTLSDHEV